MDKISELIAEHPAMFAVPDIEREQVYNELIKLAARTTKKRSMPKIERELRRALRLNEATRRAANEAEFQKWLAEINAPIMNSELH